MLFTIHGQTTRSFAPFRGSSSTISMGEISLRIICKQQIRSHLFNRRSSQRLNTCTVPARALSSPHRLVSRIATVRLGAVIAISARCQRVSTRIPGLCWYSPFPGYMSPSVVVLAPSNRKQSRATTVDCSSGRSRCSSESNDDDDDDDGEGDCCRTDESNGGDICSMAF